MCGRSSWKSRCMKMARDPVATSPPRRQSPRPLAFFSLSSLAALRAALDEMERDTRSRSRCRFLFPSLPAVPRPPSCSAVGCCPRARLKSASTSSSSLRLCSWTFARGSPSTRSSNTASRTRSSSRPGARTAASLASFACRRAAASSWAASHCAALAAAAPSLAGGSAGGGAGRAGAPFSACSSALSARAAARSSSFLSLGGASGSASTLGTGAATGSRVSTHSLESR
ncbi:unnamed protein product [Prorocentrum cordatum]|uniref:Uncharacterized protein n=1 Tax=Prorocentrum cordatum TaxID=2364126 RepID=A0ABN9S331_9DINO|nr:unnamed protein product [Polarella glacialis]